MGQSNLAEELQKPSQACNVMGYSCDTFNRYKKALNEGGVEVPLKKEGRSRALRSRRGFATQITHAIRRTKTAHAKKDLTIQID